MDDVTARLDRLAAAAGAVSYGPEKVMTLAEAARLVRPGSHVHLTSGLTRPQALCYELLRRFATGESPELTLSAMTLSGPNILLAGDGIVRHLICCYHGDTLPTPGPNPIVQRAHADGHLTVSEWSILSFTQRLLAGALRLPWMPTNSLRGSSMQAQDDVVEMDGTLHVRALRPDVAFVHAPAADPYGNTLLGGPFGDVCWGAWAATEGAIVTCERIVSPEVIAAYPQNMRLPATLVRAVVEAPFGAHPGPLFCGGVEDLTSPIAEDVAFVTEFRDACRDPDRLDAWRKQWVDVADHSAYVARLGRDRCAALRGRAELASWRQDVAAESEKILSPDAPLPGELVVVGGARELARRMTDADLTTVLAGVGLSNLAAWVARAQLAEQDTPIALMVELGLFDYAPPPGDPLLVSNRVVATARGLVGVLDILGMGLAATPSAGIVGAGQIDRFGNINSTHTADGRLLVGSGGANDVASVCRDVVVTCLQSRSRWVDDLPYITAPGDRVGCVISQLGRYDKDTDGELALTGVWGPVDEAVEAAKAACSWNLRIAPTVEQLPDPTPDELALVRAYDPHAAYTG